MNNIQKIDSFWDIFFENIIKDEININVSEEELNSFYSKKDISLNFFCFLIYYFLLTSEKIHKQNLKDTIITTFPFLENLLRKNSNELENYFYNKNLEKKFIYVIEDIDEECFNLYIVKNFKENFHKGKNLKKSVSNKANSLPEISYFSFNGNTFEINDKFENLIRNLELFFLSYSNFNKIEPPVKFFSEDTLLSKKSVKLMDENTIIYNNESKRFISALIILNIIKESLSSRSMEGYIRVSQRLEIDDDYQKYIINNYFNDLLIGVKAFVINNKEKPKKLLEKNGNNTTNSFKNINDYFLDDPLKINKIEYSKDNSILIQRKSNYSEDYEYDNQNIINKDECDNFNSEKNNTKVLDELEIDSKEEYLGQDNAKLNQTENFISKTNSELSDKFNNKENKRRSKIEKDNQNNIKEITIVQKNEINDKDNDDNNIRVISNDTNNYDYSDITTITYRKSFIPNPKFSKKNFAEDNILTSPNKGSLKNQERTDIYLPPTPSSKKETEFYKKRVIKDMQIKSYDKKNTYKDDINLPNSNKQYFTERIDEIKVPQILEPCDNLEMRKYIKKRPSGSKGRMMKTKNINEKLLKEIDKQNEVFEKKNNDNKEIYANCEKCDCIII